MKYLGFGLAVVAAYLLLQLGVIAAGFATGHYLFRVRSPRPHLTVKNIERAPGGSGYIITEEPGGSTAHPSRVTVRDIGRPPAEAAPVCTAPPGAEASPAVNSP